MEQVWSRYGGKGFMSVVKVDKERGDQVTRRGVTG
jgi:hypothetical protein